MEKSDFWGVVVNGKPIYRADCLKWGLGQFAYLRGQLDKKERGGGIFEGELIPQCTLCFRRVHVKTTMSC